MRPTHDTSHCSQHDVPRRLDRNMSRAPAREKRDRAGSPERKIDREDFESKENGELRRSKRVRAVHPHHLRGSNDSVHAALRAIEALTDPRAAPLNSTGMRSVTDDGVIHGVWSHLIDSLKASTRNSDVVIRGMWTVVIGAMGESCVYDDAFCQLINRMYGRTVLLAVRARITDTVPPEAFNTLMQIIRDTSRCIRTRSCCVTICSDISSRLVPAVGCEAGATGTSLPATSPVLLHASAIADMLDHECSNAQGMGGDEIQAHFSALSSLTQADWYRYLCINVCESAPERTSAGHAHSLLVYIRAGFIIKTINMLLHARLNFACTEACPVLQLENVRRFIGYMLGIGMPVAFAHDVAAGLVAHCAEDWIAPTGTSPGGVRRSPPSSMPNDALWLAGICAKMLQPPAGAATATTALQAIRVLAITAQGLTDRGRTADSVEFCTQFTALSDIGAFFDMLSRAVRPYANDRNVPVVTNALVALRFFAATSAMISCPDRRQSVAAAFVERPGLIVMMYGHLSGPNGGARNPWALLFLRDVLACVLRDPRVDATKSWVEHTGVLRIVFDTLMRTVCVKTLGPHWSSDVRREEVIFTCLRVCCMMPRRMVLMNALWLRKLPLPSGPEFLSWVRSLPLAPEASMMRDMVLYLLVRILMGCSALPEDQCPSVHFGGAQCLWSAVVRCASSKTIQKLLEVMCRLAGHGAAQHPHDAYGRMLPPIIGAAGTALIRLVEDYPTSSIGRMACHLLRSARVAGIDCLRLSETARNVCMLIGWPGIDWRGTKLDQANASVAAELYALDCKASGALARTSEEMRIRKLQDIADMLFRSDACGAASATEHPCVAFHRAVQPPAGSSDKEKTARRTVLLDCGCRVCRSCILYACATHKHDKCPKCLQTHLATFALSKLYPHLMSPST